jgi:hypothetical protein
LNLDLWGDDEGEQTYIEEIEDDVPDIPEAEEVVVEEYDFFQL